MHKLHLTISNTSTQTTHSVQSTTSHTHILNSNDRIRSKRTTEEHQDLEAQGKQTTLLVNQYLRENNHLGLALIARQKGIPPSLRHKVWPVLLKYHPYVIAPYINATVENESDTEIDEKRVHNDILKYFRIRTPEKSNGNSTNNSHGNSPSSKEIHVSPIEDEIIRILHSSILKFFSKWGGIVKYNSGFTWIALNLAEWFPPIQNSNYVLIGKNHANKFDPSNKHLTQIVDDDQIFNLDDSSISSTSTSTTSDENSNSSTMTFSEVYERLVLVLLHSKEDSSSSPDDFDHSRRSSLKDQINNNNSTNNLNNHHSLLTSSNTLNKSEILFKSGKPEQLISMFLNILSKVLPELYKSLSEEEISSNNKNNQWLTWWLKYCGAKVLNKFDRGRLWDSLLGFRLSYNSFIDEYESNPKVLKVFKKFYSVEDDDDTFHRFDTDLFWFRPSNNPISLKWSQCDSKFQLIFIFISILHKNESDLLEFDQFEIIELLNKLNFKKSTEELMKFDWLDNDFLQKVIVEAGELWRNWIWNEIRDEINE